MTEQEKKNLIKEALEARKYAYAPYSEFCVGAALLAEDGKIYTGCNIENASYSGSNCAEQTAVFKAVSEGSLKWKGIALAGGPAKGEIKEFVMPCGICRQVLSEFCDAQKFRILSAKSEGEWKEFSLSELLPHGFGKAALSRPAEAEAELKQAL